MRTAWNWIVIDFPPGREQGFPFIGPAGLTRERALAEVQYMLDGVAYLRPVPAELWRHGAKDDAVFDDRFIWAVYDYDAGDTPEAGAETWLDDLSTRAGTTRRDS
jgi:hypothetical protein